MRLGSDNQRRVRDVKAASTAPSPLQDSHDKEAAGYPTNRYIMALIWRSTRSRRGLTHQNLSACDS